MAGTQTLTPEELVATERALERARAMARAAVAGTGADVYLFGSRARGTERPTSDIDIAVDWHGAPLGSGILSRLREEFEESNIPFTVDVVDLAHAPAALREQALAEGIRWTG
ncbi:MAG: nucleotidyltransferase domain-containing protein [Armatimonadetes bacterium]|nr:nucleotidyltransferase domain-containing protein [Armatimonadota bacterium]